jgi:choline dehydrogenase-like flavoprotein
MRQKYRNAGQTVALGRNKISYVEGCCVGGGSEINSGLYHRTPPEVLEEWRKTFIVDGLEEWDMQPHFEAIERELSVSKLSGAAPAASLKLHQGAIALGWKSIEVPRWFAHSSSVPGEGTRRSMTRTFIPRFLDAGGALLPHTRIRRMRQENGKWLLEGMHADGREIRVLARQLILSAGTVHTPALLRRNGITRNIGNSLQTHPTVKIVARFPDPVNAAGMGVPVHQVKEFAPRLSLGCSISAPPYLALGLLDHPRELKTLTSSWHRMANYYAMITPEGRGTVRSVMGFRDPAVLCAITKMDRKNLADGLKKLAEALFAAGAERVFPCISGGPELWSASDLHKLPSVLPAGRSNLMTIHLFSSCPMGEDKARCATDSYGRVHGFENLRISDASLLCSAPGVNPQGSIMAIARRNALHLLGRL